MDWNTKPHRYTVDIPEPLVPLIEARKESVPYTSVSKYIFWTLVYDMYLRKPHRFTPWLMRQSPKVQREFFATLLNDPDIKTPGSWMETRIREEAVALIQSGAVDNLVIQSIDRRRRHPATVCCLPALRPGLPDRWSYAPADRARARDNQGADCR